MTRRVCALVTVLGMFACASKEEPAKPQKVAEEKKPVKVEEVKAKPTPPDPAPTTAVNPEPAKPTTAAPDPLPEPPQEGDEFPVMRDEAFGALKLGMKVEEVQAAVPGIAGKGKCESSEATGESLRTMVDKAAGVEVGANCDGKKNIDVAWIKIVAPSKLESKRGIAIGDAADEVTKAYADVIDEEESPPSDESIVAGSMYGGLGFTLADGKVTEMFLGAMAE